MAKDSRSTFPIIDDEGCPVDPTIFPRFTPEGNALVSSYEAFRFTESYGVIFQCNVKYCLGPCPPVRIRTQLKVDALLAICMMLLHCRRVARSAERASTRGGGGSGAPSATMATTSRCGSAGRSSSSTTATSRRVPTTLTSHFLDHGAEIVSKKSTINS